MKEQVKRNGYNKQIEKRVRITGVSVSMKHGEWSKREGTLAAVYQPLITARRGEHHDNNGQSKPSASGWKK